MTRTEIVSATSLADFLRSKMTRAAVRSVGSLDETCALAMGADLPSTSAGSEQGFARVRLVRAFPALSFAGKSRTIAVWHSR